MNGPPAQQGMRRPLEQALLVLRHGDEKLGGVQNRVHPLIGPRAVCSAPCKAGLDPHKTLVRGHDRESGGLAHHGGIGPHSRLGEPRHSGARVLLVGGQRDDEFTGRTLGRQGGRGAQEGRHPTLHVARPSSPQSSIPNLRAKRIDGHPLDTDGVQVTVEHQAPGSIPHASDHVGAARLRLRQRDIESPTCEQPGRAGGDLRLSAAGGLDTRIDGRQGHQEARQRQRVAFPRTALHALLRGHRGGPPRGRP